MVENNRMDFQKGIGEIMHELGEDRGKGLAKQGSFSWKVGATTWRDFPFPWKKKGKLI